MDSLKEWENKSLLIKASRFYYLGQQVERVFHDFETALYYLHREKGFNFCFDLIKHGFNSHE